MRHPQLKAQGDKETQDKARAIARDKPAAVKAVATTPAPTPRPSTPRSGTPRKPKPRGR